MATSIGSVNELVTLIRTQLTAHAPQAAKPLPSAKARPAAARYAQQKLAGLIELRVNQIGRDDPQRGRKAFRIFLETVLLSHFGESLVNDPGFFRMLDEVQGALERDPASAAMVTTAIDQLLSQQT